MTTASSLLTGAAAALVIACSGLSAATAAPLSAPVKIAANTETKISDATETTSALPKGGEDEPACERSRKRLWVEGEGWVVRRVTTCR